MKIFCLLALLGTAQALVGPSWTFNDAVEKPAGEKRVGSYVMAVYTQEQQERLGVDEAGNPRAIDLYDYSISTTERFSQWKRDMHKTYESVEAEKHAFSSWSSNDQYIQEMNAKDLSFKLGHNKLSDLNTEEFSKILKTRARNNPNLRRNRNVDYTLAGRVRDAPDSIDWTKQGAVTPVKDQQQCGSCWAFSTTGSVEGAYYLATKHLVSLSEQELVSCDTLDHGCEGGIMDDGFKFAEEYGICKEEDYPYVSGSGISFQCTKNCTAVVKVTNFTDVPENDEDALMVAVAGQPVSVAVEADKRPFQLYKKGVMSSPFCGTKLDHGVLVVGYGEALLGEKYWKVKNSWGDSWGEAGYIRLERGKNMCGIAMQASYPSVKPL